MHTRTERRQLAWRANLALAPRRRSPEETERIKDRIGAWLDTPPLAGRPTQEELARSLGVSKQYVSKMVRRLKGQRLDMEAAREPVAPAVPAAPQLAPLNVIYVRPAPGAAEALARSGLSAKHWRDVPVVDQLP